MQTACSTIDPYLARLLFDLPISEANGCNETRIHLTDATIGTGFGIASMFLRTLLSALAISTTDHFIKDDTNPLVVMFVLQSIAGLRDQSFLTLARELARQEG